MTRRMREVEEVRKKRSLLAVFLKFSAWQLREPSKRKNQLVELLHVITKEVLQAGNL